MIGRLAFFSRSSARSTSARAGRAGAGGWNGRARLRPGHLIGAHHGFHQRVGRSRLIIPFHEIADHAALVGGRVDPVDIGTALGRIDGPGRAQDEHRRAIDEGVVDRHHAVHQADVGMEDAGHRLARRLGVALRDRDRMILVHAQDHARTLVAQMVDDGIVQTAVACAGVEAHIGELEPAQHLRGDVAAPPQFLVRLPLRLVPQHARSLLAFSLSLRDARPFVKRARLALEPQIR